MEVIRTSEGGGAKSRVLPAFPVAVGAVVICAIQIGVVGTLIVAAVTVAIVAGALWAYGMHVSRSVGAQLSHPYVPVVVDANWDGKPGKASISPAGLSFAAKRGSPISVPVDEIRRVEIASGKTVLPVGRAVFFIVDGSQIRVTFTAAADDISQALGA